MTKRNATHALLPALCLGMGLVSQSIADPVEPGPRIDIELSTAQSANSACQLSFVVTNHYATDISQAVYEIVLFDAQEKVAQMSLLDFQALPAGRARVRQFAFDNTDCGSISRVLVNGASICNGDGASSDCITGLTVSSRTRMELVG